MITDLSTDACPALVYVAHDEEDDCPVYELREVAAPVLLVA